MVQRTGDADVLPTGLSTRPRLTIVQFWHDLARLPDDVNDCIESWRRLEVRGFDVQLFDTERAADLIANRLGPRHQRAFERCYHPAMQSDYFRLCYVFLEGGCYLDADDVHSGKPIEHLFDDGRLKIQPLCYDTATDSMVPVEVFARPGAYAPSWIFYFNNDPLLAGPGHPIVERALANATAALEFPSSSELPDIQSTTGPGNLTRTIFELAQEHAETAPALLVLRDWEAVSTSRWPLSYRHDARNWRLSDRRAYEPQR
jgi:mannosyltransferase OCH1-like enzyme